MDAFEKYLEYEERIDELEDAGKWDEADKLEDEQISVRDNEFTREDWLRLIDDAKGSKKAVYEYTHMMNKKFPQKQHDIPDDVLSLYGAEDK